MDRKGGHSHLESCGHLRGAKRIAFAGLRQTCEESLIQDEVFLQVMAARGDDVGALQREAVIDENL